MQNGLTNAGGFISTSIADRREERFAAAALLFSFIIFVAVVPFAKRPLPHVLAFAPAYGSALTVCDLITAVLLFGQFSVFRSRALFVLACGYLFTACLAFAHALITPTAFSPTGLLGAGSQSSPWLYLFWHGGFPLAVISYALLNDNGREAAGGSDPSRRSPGRAIRTGIAGTVVVACGLTLIATASHAFLPIVILGNTYTSTFTATASGIWLLSLLALLVLLWRKPHTVLDLWLMIVMVTWLLEIALSAILNAGRFDLGWYTGRLYGLLAAGFLLIVLLNESGKHYARLSQLSAALSGANTDLAMLSLQDGLTDLANRRSFDTYLAEQIALARRQKWPLALILCDVDSFKAFNDQYGHQAGDECLKQVAAALSSCCRRPSDMTARYGGEEFAMILPDTSLAGAAQIAEAARVAVARLRISHAQSPVAPHVSISGGVAVLRKFDLTAPQLIVAADQALYEAKRLGRNRMVSVEAEADQVAAAV